MTLAADTPERGGVCARLPPPAEPPVLLPPGPDMTSSRPTATSSRCTRLANSAIPGKKEQNSDFQTDREVTTTLLEPGVLEFRELVSFSPIVVTSSAQTRSVLRGAGSDPGGVCVRAAGLVNELSS